MKQKTISGHYGATYSLKHNNRDFVPKNVDVDRIKNNYNCIAVGAQAFPDGNRPINISEMWDQYRYICDLYWSQRELYKTIEQEKTREKLRELRRLYYDIFRVPHDPFLALMKLLFMPVLIPCGVFIDSRVKEAKAEVESERFNQWVRDRNFKLLRTSMRETLKSYDIEKGTRLCGAIDELVGSMLVIDDEGNLIDLREDDDMPQKDYSQAKFASIEQIYEKCFEPSFREFQDRQRPCRRYEGTYLEQIREKQVQADQRKGSKNEKNRSVAEAIEIVFGIGDMDNTGYARAPMDAQQSETLLKDFCDHLLQCPHICYVTTLEIEDPDWQPPFKNGLIVLNLTVHCDEATPGVHLTCIPYSRGCKRGPDAQAALGRAMTGMGYPSTWTQVLDQNGNPIPKRDKDGNVILNSDGTSRYLQEPVGQGIVDWIEAQKQWISTEMQKRYGWKREYKGSHPRGNLSTPDYKVARAMERLAELERTTQSKVQEYEERVKNLTISLEKAVSVNWDTAVERDAILQYLTTCPDEQYEQLLDVAVDYLQHLPVKEQKTAIQNFHELLQNANGKAAEQQRNVRPTQTMERGI